MGGRRGGECGAAKPQRNAAADQDFHVYFRVLCETASCYFVGLESPCPSAPIYVIFHAKGLFILVKLSIVRCGTIFPQLCESEEYVSITEGSKLYFPQAAETEPVNEGSLDLTMTTYAFLLMHCQSR